MDRKKSQDNVRTFLDSRMLVKTSVEAGIIDAYARNAAESLETADGLFKDKKSDLWVIVCSYYSMYYIANAVICKLGYKVGRKISHQITYDVLAAFVTDRLANDMLEEYEEARKEAMDIANTEAEDIIDDFGREKNKRSIFQYEMAEKVKHSKAETS